MLNLDIFLIFFFVNGVILLLYLFLVGYGYSENGIWIRFEILNNDVIFFR